MGVEIWEGGVIRVERHRIGDLAWGRDESEGGIRNVVRPISMYDELI